MSLEGIDDLVENWQLNNNFTLVNGVVEGDLTLTGFLYDSAIPSNVLVSNNVFTGTNTYTNHLPEYLLPTTNNEMNTREYTNTTFNGIGNNLLSTASTFSGSNTFNVMPIPTQNSTGDQLVNKQTTDTIINSFNQLSTNNNWTGNNFFNNFANDVTTPDPTLDNHISNKNYVDTSVVNFNNTGGKVDLVELGAEGQQVFNCDPNIYSSMIVCLVTGGGYGSPNLNPDFQGVISFGGSGAFISFKMPAFTGNGNYEAVFNTRTTVGYSNLYTSNGEIIIGATNGRNGTVNASGTGGVSMSSNPSIAFNQYQMINGTTQSRLATSTIRRVANIACWNGFGQGGSFDYVLANDVLPTNNYLLLIKFRN